MASIARKSEYVVASVAVLLGLTSLVGACSNNNRQPETTGSIAQAQPRQAYNSTLPPAISAPQTTQATYAPRQAYAPPPVYRTSYRSTQACNCPPPRRYDRRYDRGDVTASIPQTQPAYAQQPANFIVHPIAPRDTLYSISRHYGTSMDDIAAVNRIRTDSTLQVGELLVVPTR